MKSICWAVLDLFSPTPPPGWDLCLLGKIASCWINSYSFVCRAKRAWGELGGAVGVEGLWAEQRNALWWAASPCVFIALLIYFEFLERREICKHLWSLFHSIGQLACISCSFSWKRFFSTPLQYFLCSSLCLKRKSRRILETVLLTSPGIPPLHLPWPEGEGEGEPPSY